MKATSNSSIKLLIDGDILVYRMGFATQTKDGIPEPVYHATHLVNKLLYQLMEKFETTKLKIYLTSEDRSNFRFELATIKPYKGNRNKALNPNAVGKPVHYQAIRDHLVNKWHAEVITGKEADDALGIEQMKNIDSSTLRTIIVTLDKDLDMIPGWHYNFVQDRLYDCRDPGILILSETRKKLQGTGLKWFYAQLLLGDTSDNIPGLKGYGPAKTFDLLDSAQTEEEFWSTVTKIYLTSLEKTLTNEAIYARLYEVVDLLWMHRKEDDCKSEHLRGLKLC